MKRGRGGEGRQVCASEEEFWQLLGGSSKNDSTNVGNRDLYLMYRFTMPDSQ